MKKRIIMEVEIPDGLMAEMTFDRIWDATISGLNKAKYLFKGTPHGKFRILHQKSETFEESMWVEEK